MLFDVGHANVVAGFMGVELMTLLEPVLDYVRLFHVHDNLGARLGGEGGAVARPAAARPAPGAGLGIAALGVGAPGAARHDAPLLMEIHPAHRPQPATLHDIAVSVIGGREAPDQEMAPDAVSARTTVPSASR